MGEVKLVADDRYCCSCGETDDERCPKSQKPCNHHRNHSWTHDSCCWCGVTFGEDGAETYASVGTAQTSTAPSVQPSSDVRQDPDTEPHGQ